MVRTTAYVRALGVLMVVLIRVPVLAAALYLRALALQTLEAVGKDLSTMDREKYAIGSIISWLLADLLNLHKLVSPVNFFPLGNFCQCILR